MDEQLGKQLHFGDESKRKINERSESFNDRLGDQVLPAERRDSFTEHIAVTEAVRRESFNEKYLRNARTELNERRSSFNENEAMGSPFVSMPTIPAVYGDTTQPLEKVTLKTALTLTEI